MRGSENMAHSLCASGKFSSIVYKDPAFKKLSTSSSPTVFVSLKKKKSGKINETKKKRRKI
jgi:hypothetical protein